MKARVVIKAEHLDPDEPEPRRADEVGLVVEKSCSRPPAPVFGSVPSARQENGCALFRPLHPDAHIDQGRAGSWAVHRKWILGL